MSQREKEMDESADLTLNETDQSAYMSPEQNSPDDMENEGIKQPLPDDISMRPWKLPISQQEHNF